MWTSLYIFVLNGLKGTTNPQERDNQIRTPVFLVGKDFVSAVTLKTGVAHHGGAQIRPYDIKGSNGIIPKVKINYTEVASYCASTKDMCRNGCEQVYRFLSDKVRKGEPVQMEIPFVGVFLVKSGIAAVSFYDELNEETRGMTAKGHLVNKLFANSNNRMNMQIHDDKKAKLNPSVGMGGAMRLTGDAESWLKSNLNISV
jgi:CCDC81 eukaryotic HU domain 2